MRSLAVPLGYSLTVVTFLVNQIHFATAVCTNTTNLIAGYYMIGIIHGGPPYFQESVLDFISCPSSQNLSCELKPKAYTITVAPQFNLSAVGNATFEDSNRATADFLQAASHVIDLPLNSSDRKGILDVQQAAFPPSINNDGKNAIFVFTKPMTFTATAQSVYDEISYKGRDNSSLTVEPGYNLTLTYVPYLATMWWKFGQCDNKTLDGAIIGVITPYSFISPLTNEDFLKAGMYRFIKTPLNDAPPVTDTKDDSGVGLKAWNGWATALIVCGVLAFNWL